MIIDEGKGEEGGGEDNEKSEEGKRKIDRSGEERERERERERLKKMTAVSNFFFYFHNNVCECEVEGRNE